MVLCRCPALALTVAGVAVSLSIVLQGEDRAALELEVPGGAAAQRVARGAPLGAAAAAPPAAAADATLGSEACGGAPEACRDVSERRPKYAKVDGSIETLWQAPRAADVKGVLFMAHGCNHQATDFFTEMGADGWRLDACAASRFGRCLGLPEERQLVEEARNRGYYVVAVSGTGWHRCWDFSKDPVRVRKALDYVFRAEGLNDTLPILATGASSGGAFMSAFALAMRRPPVCVVPQISALDSAGSLSDFAALRVPTLFVHMALHDPGTAARIDGDVRELEAHGVPTKQIRVLPTRPADELAAHFSKEEAEELRAALEGGGLLKPDGTLATDPRRSAWRGAPGLRNFVAGKDTLIADESALAELMNVAWAGHEFTAKFASQMLDFCEGKPITEVA